MTRAWLGWIGMSLGLGLGLAAVAKFAGAVPWLSRPTSPDRLLAQAQADYQAGRHDAAAIGLVQLARLRAPTPMDHMARALVARARGEDALSELAQIPGDHPLSSQARLLAGQVEVANGRLRVAEAHLLAALEREPTNAHAHHELAYIYNVQQRLHEMDQRMESLSELDALGFDHLLHWGKVHNVVWDPSTDCESLTRCLAADPSDRYTRLALVDGLRNLGRLEQAVAVLSVLPDSDDNARARRALLTLESGDAERALRLLAAGPDDHPSLAKARGQVALHRHDTVGAIRYLRIALAARPDDYSVLSALATALRVSGDLEGAKDYLAAQRRHNAVTALIAQAATPAGRSDSRLPARLGAACEAAGRLAEARAWYRLAIARDPLDSESQQAVFRIRQQSVERLPSGHAVDDGPHRESMAESMGRR